MTRSTLFLALALTFGAIPAYALLGRVGARSSMTCAVLLQTTNALRTHAFVPIEIPVEGDGETLAETAAPAPKSPDVLLDVTYEGVPALTRFGNGIAKARQDLRDAYTGEFTLGSGSEVGRFLRRMVQYPLSPLLAYSSLMNLVEMVRALPEIINTPWVAPMVQVPVVVGLLSAYTAVGLYDYSLRWLSSYDLSLWRMERGLFDVRNGRIARYGFTRDFYVSRTFAGRVAEGRPLAWPDLHRQNVFEEMPGVWRWFKYRKDDGGRAQRMRLTFAAEQVGGAPRVTVRLVRLP